MGLDLSQFHDLFFEETAQHLAEIDAALARLDAGGGDRIALGEIHRLAHSIKGGSATFGFDEMVIVGKALSDVLDRARKGELILDRDGISACASASQVLGQQLSARRDGAALGAGDGQSVAIRLAGIGQDAAAGAAAGSETVFDLRFSISRSAVGADLVADDVLRQLSALGTIAVVIRPQGGETTGEWRIGLRSGAAVQDVRAVLELLAEPGSVRISRRGDGAVAPPAVGHPNAVWPEGEGSHGTPTLARMGAVAREMRESSGKIAALAAQMEQLSARHAVLLEEAAELGRRLARETRVRRVADAEGATVPREGQGARETDALRRRGACRAPLPKVERARPLRPSLADEWEEY